MELLKSILIMKPYQVQLYGLRDPDEQRPGDQHAPGQCRQLDHRASLGHVRAVVVGG